LFSFNPKKKKSGLGLARMVSISLLVAPIQTPSYRSHWLPQSYQPLHISSLAPRRPQIVVLMTTMTPVAGCHEHSLRYVPTSFPPMSKAVYSLPATAPTNKPLTTRYRCVHAFFNRESWYSFTKDFVLRFFLKLLLMVSSGVELFWFNLLWLEISTCIDL
jgi:hypothetical protein